MPKSKLSKVFEFRSTSPSRENETDTTTIVPETQLSQSIMAPSQHSTPTESRRRASVSQPSSSLVRSSGIRRSESVRPTSTASTSTSASACAASSSSSSSPSPFKKPFSHSKKTLPDSWRIIEKEKSTLDDLECQLENTVSMHNFCLINFIFVFIFYIFNSELNSG